MPKLGPAERARIQAKLDELAGHGWQDSGELSEANKQAVDSALERQESKRGQEWETG